MFGGRLVSQRPIGIKVTFNLLQFADAGPGQRICFRGFPGGNRLLGDFLAQALADSFR